MTNWDYETDLLIVGSGAGGMTAALVGKLEGLDSLILEKTEYFGGSTALSGGFVWVPDNYVMAEMGLPDSHEKAALYLKTIIGDRVPQEKQEVYLQSSKEMLAYLKEHIQVRFQLTPGYTDYYPELPGGTNGGRGVDTNLGIYFTDYGALSSFHLAIQQYWWQSPGSHSLSHHWKYHRCLTAALFCERTWALDLFWFLTRCCSRGYLDLGSPYAES